jgi:hypothetical protein
MTDPALVVERREESRTLIQNVVDAVLELPQRQRHVMICSLQDRIHDPHLLEGAFAARKQDIKKWDWPQDKVERQRLQASLSYARHNVARGMHARPALVCV